MFRFFVATNQNLKIILLYKFVWYLLTRKENLEIVKEELLNVLRKSDTVKEQEFNMQHTIDQREAIDIIKRYKDIIKTNAEKF